jgi:DNA-binding transcriptional regulator YiaG
MHKACDHRIESCEAEYVAMAATVSAEVNPTLLAWAREQSGYAPENVAKRLGVKLDRLEAWERGDLKPTVRQAQELAILPSAVRCLLPSPAPSPQPLLLWPASIAVCPASSPAWNRLSSDWPYASCCSGER